MPDPRRNNMDTTQKNREQSKAAPREEKQHTQARRPARETEQPRPRRPRPEAQTPRREGGTAQRTQKAPAAGQPKRPAARQSARTKAPAPRRKQNPLQKLGGIFSRKSAGKAAAQAAARPSSKSPARRPQRRPEEPTDLSTKKRAYGNSKPKKKSAFAQARDMVVSAARKATAKSRSKRGGGTRSTQPAPAIIYTQPKAFSRTRLLIQMLTVTAVVAAMIAGLSVFFKVEYITVTGAEVYSAWSVREASGIQEGDNLLTFSHARAGALIKANLPYVNTVRFGIKLPDTVNIIIEEDAVVYSIEDSTGTWWLMNSDGRVVEQTNKSKAANYTKILGITLENPAPDKQAVATETVLSATTETGETIPMTTTGAKRLSTAMEILEALEANDIVGEAASVDVSRLEDIIVWYGSRYQVNLGDSSNVDYKIACMNDVILQLSEFDSGILDVSFTIWPDQVIYTPFA